MAGTRQETIINNATFNATVTSPVLPNDGRASWVLLSKVGAMTTTPTMTVAIYGSLDGTNFHLIDTQTVINSANAVQRTVYSLSTTKGPILEPYIQVVATFGGTGSFANVNVVLFGGGYLY